MKYAILVILAAMSLQAAGAKKVKFETEQSAVDVIKAITTKYWEKQVIADMTETKVEVSLQSGALVFVERSKYNRPAATNRAAFTEEKTITTQVNLNKATLTNTLTSVMFLEQQPNSIRQQVAWSTKALDNSDGYLKTYTLPLDYERVAKEVNDLKSIKEAIAYLSSRYLPKPAKKKFSIRQGQ